MTQAAPEKPVFKASTREIVVDRARLPALFAQLCAVPRLFFDVETTSGDDAQEAFHPWQGHRVCGYGLMNDAGDAWYLPARHRPAAVHANLPLEAALEFMRALGAANPVRVWVGHNIKFDARFAWQDSVELAGELHDTVVLARLVDPLRFSASLDVLSEQYLARETRKDSRAVNDYLAAAKSKDYGVVPPDVLGAYCLQDLAATRGLYHLFARRVAEASQELLWGIEVKATRELLLSELRGVRVNQRGLAVSTFQRVHALIEGATRLTELVGEPVDVLSNKDLTRVLRDKLHLTPLDFTKTGAPSWSAETLRQYALPVTDVIAEMKEASYFVSNFGEGWVKRLGPDGFLHPNFQQFGARTGRLSCVDPNFQNLDEDAKGNVHAREGYTLVSIDASQIEFRVFAHYTNSPRIIERYNADPRMDYHQETADLLGIPREETKSLNFGLIFGMGKEKLQNQLILFIKAALRGGESKVLEALRRFNFAEPVRESDCARISANVYNHMHRLFPEIRQLARRVEATIAERAKLAPDQRGFVTNALGRRYYVTQAFAHKARNYIIQGTAADLLKDWLARLRPILAQFEAYLLANVHDEVLFEVPTSSVEAFITAVIPALETPTVPLRVPLRVKVSVCDGAWAAKRKWEKSA